MAQYLIVTRDSDGRVVLFDRGTVEKIWNETTEQFDRIDVAPVLRGTPDSTFGEDIAATACFSGVDTLAPGFTERIVDLPAPIRKKDSAWNGTRVVSATPEQIEGWAAEEEAGLAAADDPDAVYRAELQGIAAAGGPDAALAAVQLRRELARRGK